MALAINNRFTVDWDFCEKSVHLRLEARHWEKEIIPNLGIWFGKGMDI